ncbi:hypothetical protein KVT40_000126 [Elsinoe batatas]|uniref:Phospholipid/glycerol acyltransferase domain-containing protein n=1 Tax=Elsinoe batatas TaxID=2601811 RepID=A0A8K0L6S2_9PEZI|nr:hypothetical protein KVT40_000126 [Elsinoe batatas]
MAKDLRPTVFAILVLEVLLALRIKRTLAWDDALVVVGYLFVLAYTIGMCVCVVQGFGRPATNYSVPGYIEIIKTERIFQGICVLAYIPTKAAVAATQMRIFPGKILHAVLWFVIFSLFASYGINTILWYLECRPISATWNRTPTSNCWNPNVYLYNSYFTGSWGAFLDFVLVAIPWFYISKLNMKRRDRIAVASAMSLGIFAGVTALIKTQALGSVTSRTDYAYDTIGLVLWAATELFCVQVAACLPLCRPVVQQITGKWHSTRGSTGPRISYPLNDSISKGSENKTSPHHHQVLRSRTDSEEQILVEAGLARPPAIPHMAHNMADSDGMRQRKPLASLQPNGHLVHELKHAPEDDHPAGPVKHGKPKEILRIFLFALYFFGSCLFIHSSQILGIPLYWIDRDQYYTWMAVTKQHFGLLITTMTQWWSPTIVRISGDSSMAGQLHVTPEGRVECAFPERLVLVANHQIYTDWLYLWWIAYTAGQHGHIYIILKQSLKWVPLIGPAMQLYSFIFMARKWASDQARMAYRLQKLRTEHKDDKGNTYLNPMWLLIFPEGTNLSANTRASSAKWAEKSGTKDLKHALLPRSTGLQFCLAQLKGSVDYVYDCTIAYERIPEGQYGQDIYTLRSVYFQGRPPKSVNMHWRRFKVADIPVDDKEAMEKWVLDRWAEKDELLEQHHQTGRFPSDAVAVTIQGKKEHEVAHIETEVRPKNPIEFLQIFVPVTAVALVVNVLVRLVTFATTGRFRK